MSGVLGIAALAAGWNAAGGRGGTDPGRPSPPAVVQGDVQDVSPVRVLGAFLIVVSLLGGLAAWRRRACGTGPNTGDTAPRLEVEDRVHLGDKCRLVTVRWEGRRYLMGVAPGGIQVLDRDPSPALSEGSATRPGQVELSPESPCGPRPARAFSTLAGGVADALARRVSGGGA